MNIAVDTRPSALEELLSAAAVRARCRIVCDFVLHGRSAHWTIDLDRLPQIAAYVGEVAREAYADLAIPYHSRWRHFDVGGVDRWAALAARIEDVRERARAAVDLATVSVLLDAGAGARWRYREADRVLTRSEGLAVASLAMFAAGAFSSAAGAPLSADAAALEAIDADTLGRFFQVDAGNPLLGLEQRATLLRRLGRALHRRPDVFGGAGRVGNLVDHLAATYGRCIPAPAILQVLLQTLSAIWPSGLVVDCTPLGDAARHPAIEADDATAGIVPFHKLSQWLAYSLIEPLEGAGIVVTEIDGLTALAEYRNGGLLVDLGVMVPREPAALATPQAIASPLVVEWRAATVTLLDRLLPLVRAELGVGAAFTLPHMLQAGTWSAGRKIAQALRPPAGEPPLSIVADGTVF